MPISLLSVIGDTGLLPYITANISNTHTTRVPDTTLYSDDITHIKQHRSKEVQPNGSLCASNHCNTPYEQVFRHNKHIHTNHKLLQTRIPGTIIRFIANYIKGRKAYTTYINHTSSQRQFKAGTVQLMAYTDDR